MAGRLVVKACYMMGWLVVGGGLLVGRFFFRRRGGDCWSSGAGWMVAGEFVSGWRWVVEDVCIVLASVPNSE